MRVFIAEKPSLAKAIAANFGAQFPKDGYIEITGNDVVTWCYGHMLESLKPEEYDKKWQSWDLDKLPIRVSEWRLKPRKDAEKQLKGLACAAVAGGLEVAGEMLAARGGCVPPYRRAC
jgi:DNA topoisomerase-3